MAAVELYEGTIPKTKTSTSHDDDSYSARVVEHLDDGASCSINLSRSRSRSRSIPSLTRRWSLLLLSFLTVSLVSGLVYGWPALRRNLRDVGGSTLSEQTLGGIYTAGAWSTQGGRFLFGLARDKYGTKKTTLVSLLCVIGGSLGIALSDPNGAAQLGISMFFIGLGSGAQLCLQPVAGLFSRSGTVIASLSGAFQISGLVFLALVSITDNNNNNSNRAHSFGGFAALVTVLALISGAMLPWGSSFVLPEEEDSKDGIQQDEQQQIDNDNEGERAVSGEYVEGKDRTVTETNKPEPMSRLLTRYRMLIFHSEYLALITWFSLCVVPLQYYIGSIGFQLEEKGDDGDYTNLFSILYAAAAALAPLGGYTADILGLGITQGLASTLCALSMFILASGVSLKGQAVGLAAYGIGRMLVFGMYFSNVGKRFGYANFGLLAGLGLLISAVISLVQYPLIALAADGKARQVNIASGAVLVGVIPYCIWLGIRERRVATPHLNDKGQKNNEDEEEHKDTEDFRDTESALVQESPVEHRRRSILPSFVRHASYFGQ